MLEGFGIYGRLREVCQTDVDGTFSGTIEEVAAEPGLEAEPVETTHKEAESFARSAALASVPLPNKSDQRYLALLQCKGRDAVILAPDLSTRRLPSSLIAAALTADIEAPFAPGVEALLRKAGVARRRFRRARRAMLGERLSNARINVC